MFAAVRKTRVEFLEARNWSLIDGNQSMGGKGLVPIVLLWFVHFTDCAMDHNIFFKLSDDQLVDNLACIV